MRVEDHKVKHLRGNKIALVKVVWEGPDGESMEWELECQMRESYLALFPSGNFRGQKFSKRGRVVTPRNLIYLFIQIFCVFV